MIASDIVKGGGNPADKRAAKAAHAERHSNTLTSAIGLELMEKRAREGMTLRSVDRDRRTLEKYLAPIYDIPISQVTAPALLATLRKLKQRGVIETTHRARALAGRVFKYAIATGRVERNPVADLTGALEQPQIKHFSSVTNPDQIGDLLRALHGYPVRMLSEDLRWRFDHRMAITGCCAVAARFHWSRRYQRNRWPDLEGQAIFGPL